MSESDLENLVESVDLEDATEEGGDCPTKEAELEGERPTKKVEFEPETDPVVQVGGAKQRAMQ